MNVTSTQIEEIRKLKYIIQYKYQLQSSVSSPQNDSYSLYTKDGSVYEAGINPCKEMRNNFTYVLETFIYIYKQVPRRQHIYIHERVFKRFLKIFTKNCKKLFVSIADEHSQCLPNAFVLKNFDRLSATCPIVSISINSK